MKALTAYMDNDLETHFQDLLPDLLNALQWKGHERSFSEIFGRHNTHTNNVETFLNVMADFGYIGTMRMDHVDRISHNAYPIVVLNTIHTYDLALQAADIRDDRKKIAYITFKKKEALLSDNSKKGIFAFFNRFHGLLLNAFVMSIVIGVMALVPAIYNIALYDQVLPSGSSDSIPMLFLGAMLALVAEIFLRHMRNRNLSYLGARMDHYVSTSVFDRLVHLPPLYTERTSTSSQLARLRDFDSVREFFTGPLASLFFEMPLAFLYLGVMALIAGPLALVPLCLIAAYGVLIVTALSTLRLCARESAHSASMKHEFLVETLNRMDDIRLAGLEDVWQNRFEKLAHKSSSTSARASVNAQAIEVISYALMTLGGLSTLVLGVVLVLNQSLTTGVLLGSMILIWRIISPFQLFCASLTRVQQLAASTRQIQSLLAVNPEKDLHDSSVSPFLLKGEITFSRVSLRYAAESEPALLGVSFAIKPGQVVAIKGDNGSGKSTILKLILGLYTPQAGSVRLDGMDVRQFDPPALRQSIAYVPQLMEVLPGTILDNVYYTNPLVSEQECVDALRQSLAWEEIERLPHGIHTIISGENAEPISFMLKQRINLARAYLKKSKIMLFDEASHSLGPQNDKAFIQTIRTFKGKRTIIMTTHREDHMRLADILLVMHKGELVHAGNPTQILSALQYK